MLIFSDRLPLGVDKQGFLMLSLSITNSVTGIIPSSVLALDYLKLQPPDEDDCTIALKLNLTNPTPLAIDSVSPS
jgi:hypothetical protein